MSLFAILHSSAAALGAQSRALQTTANNVANAETPGYARQRTELTTARPINRGGLLLGQGVSAATVSAAFDSFAQRQVISGFAEHGYAETRSTAMRGIEIALAEGEDGGLGERLNELFDSFSLMEADPTSPALRLNVLGRADEFATAMRRGAAVIQTQQDEANAAVGDIVGQVNDLAGQLAGLNANIQQLEAGGHRANDLRVQRANTVETLAALGQTRVTERDDGSLGVLFAGHTLVEGDEARTLSAVEDATTGNLEVHVSQGSTTFDITNSIGSAGKLGAVLTTRDVTTPELMAQLDALAFNVATEVNAQHQAGFGLDGSTGNDFFAPPLQQAGAASALSLDVGMVGNVDAIAASGSAATLPGGNTNISALADLAESLSMAGGTRTFSSYYGEVVASLGENAASAYADESRAYNQLSTAMDVRDANSAVSLEEEALDLIRFQEAYQAAARVISATNDLFDDLMSIVR